MAITGLFLLYFIFDSPIGKRDARAFGEVGAFTLSHLLLRDYNLTLISYNLMLIPKTAHAHKSLKTPSKPTLHAHQPDQRARRPLPYPSFD